MSGGRLDDDVTPGRAIRLRAVLDTDASAGALAALPFDFERYVAVEPRLRSARWIGGAGPYLGARADIVADIPYTVPLVGRVLGAPEVIAQVTHWRPPTELGASFDGRRVTGFVHVTVESAGSGSRVAVNGFVTPRSPFARLALRPVTPLLERLATGAIERGVTRAAAAVTSGIA